LDSAARLKGESDTQLAAAQTETDRLKVESDRLRQESERLRQENDAQRTAAQADLDRAAKEKAQAEAERTQLRAQLLLQFNTILQTRDTARGLIVNMSDVLFDTAKHSLRPAAREKLAKVAGIISGHPGLRLAVEGYTDSVGGDDYNQKLSEDRGTAVRDYLTQEGVAGTSVTSKGFGKSQPVASNDTAAGRQQNRRVELVVSGEIIGEQIGQPVAVR
jgi:outer membrane protein OmpA-like peptidoglycan-associated protein